LLERWPECVADLHSRYRNEANNAYPRCNNIARALRDYADTLHILQSHFKNITAEANKPGLQVDA
jgi:hypothetical protein